MNLRFLKLSRKNLKRFDYLKNIMPKIQSNLNSFRKQTPPASSELRCTTPAISTGTNTRCTGTGTASVTEDSTGSATPSN